MYVSLQNLTLLENKIEFFHVFFINFNYNDEYDLKKIKKLPLTDFFRETL